jgi:hypothetical protein
MMRGAVLILATSWPLLLTLGLLALGAWRERRRAAVVSEQIRLTEAIADELGAVVAPIVTKPLGGPWRAEIRVPVGQPAVLSRIVAIAHDTLTRSGASPYELVLTPRTPAPGPLRVVTRRARRLRAA